MERNTEGRIISANAEDVAGAVLANNHEFITEMFEWMHIKQGDPPPSFLPSNSDLSPHTC